ncbi:MAG: Smr/MutS family protein [Bacteroidota bacterium]|nr:Smr/MutS family protein [Bacteroidota bacterium]
MAHTFSVGDRVRFLHQIGEGIVQAVEENGQTLLVEDGDGFPMRFAAKDCLPVPNAAEEVRAYASKEISKGELLERNVDETVLKAAQKDFDVKYRNPNATNMRKRDEHMEVDLHYHVLTGVRDSASPHEMLSLQMEHFDRMMRRAEEKRIPRIVFIHGVGQGRLRQEIRDALASYWPQCTCREGDPRKYGHGATEVRFKGG